MKSFIAKEPMELLAVEVLSLEKGKGGFENILVATDSFTKFSWPFPTRNQKATTVAKPVREDFHQLRNAPTFALRPGS